MSTKPINWNALADAAREAARRSYSPYSRFPVGAALSTPDGKVYGGTNVENASYGLTCCAERSAIFSMVSAGEQALTALVIYTPTPKATAPCGACRQVIFEFGETARIRAICDGDEELEWDVDTLLPGAFGPRSL